MTYSMPIVRIADNAITSVKGHGAHPKGSGTCKDSDGPNSSQGAYEVDE